MIQADLISINHIKPNPPVRLVGGIVREFVCGRDDTSLLDARWCDMRAPHHIWSHRNAYNPATFETTKWPIPPIIGFHGYRKHINFRDPMKVERWQLAPGWGECHLMSFLSYQEWLIKNLTGDKLKLMLEDVDVLTVTPFKCRPEEGMVKDYQRSRSPADWAVFEDVMKAHGSFDFSTPFIRPMHFVTEDIVFFQWMRFFDKVRRDLEPLVKSPDNDDPAYRSRALAFLAERMWSLWLDASGLRIKEYPLLICWRAE